MVDDPQQLRNLANIGKVAATKPRLDKRVNAFLEEQDDPRMQAETPWDTYPFSDKRISRNHNWRNESFSTTSVNVR
jgi:hypothetical protein